jgi:putative acetyltransferase
MMAIRRFELSDLTSIIDIYNKSKLDELANESAQFELLPLKQDAKRFNALMASDIFVYDLGRIVAYGAVLENEVRALFVGPEARGQGIATQLLTEMLKGMDGPVSLCVVESNISAKSLYEKFGFVVTDKFKTEYNGMQVVVNTMATV